MRASAYMLMPSGASKMAERWCPNSSVKVCSNGESFRAFWLSIQKMHHLIRNSHFKAVRGVMRINMRTRAWWAALSLFHVQDNDASALFPTEA